MYARLKRADRLMLEEGPTPCCYAESEKSRIEDPQGIQWETFLTTGESTTHGHDPVRASARGHRQSGVLRTVLLRSSFDLTPVPQRPYNVLFLCTGNSAHSILAEALINHWGRGKFRGLSAGSHPRAAVRPITLELLRQVRLPTEG